MKRPYTISVDIQDAGTDRWSVYVNDRYAGLIQRQLGWEEEVFIPMLSSGALLGACDAVDTAAEAIVRDGRGSLISEGMPEGEYKVVPR